MIFQKKDMDTWDRAEIFCHFIDELRCVMSMTVELDVTAFVNALKKRGCSFYPSMLWVVSAAVNQREELRMGYNAQGEAGTWTFVSPYYAHFHKEDERFVKLVTVYSPCFETFYQRFCEDKRRFATYRGFEQTEIPPNTFDVSCLPWTHYRSFDMHVFDKGTYLAPVITWGRYLEKEGRLMLPLSLNLHHAAGDGHHLCRFFSDVETWMQALS